jgi:hypothetical protein
MENTISKQKRHTKYTMYTDSITTYGVEFKFYHNTDYFIIFLIIKRVLKYLTYAPIFSAPFRVRVMVFNATFDNISVIW